MDPWLLDQELPIRLGCFAGMLALLGSLELVVPARRQIADKRRRWLAHLKLAVLNGILLRALSPAATIGLAWSAAQHGWGLLHQLDLPYALAVVLSLVVLDLGIYLQHVSLHAVPVLWRVHRVHHADPDVDVTTGLRFHPLEMLLSLGIKGTIVVGLGAPVLAALLFEIVLNAASMFHHANLRLPAKLDRVLRWGLVTPDMHRIHHSVDPSEMHRNFGFHLSCWDRLLGTYRERAALGRLEMTLGLSSQPEPPDPSLLGIVLSPFRTDPGGSMLAREPESDPTLKLLR